MEQMSRSQARVKAFELIFMIDSCESIDFELDRIAAELKEHKKHVRYIRQAVEAVCEHKPEIDNLISDNLGKGWSLKRLSRMSLAILRLATAEIMYMEDIPASVSVNEAVELSKTYGDENEPSFINGVLGVIAK